ncbi:hypothetical protein [Streptomyces sp. enrichment culture]|uniref:hypothetical protein n=1 Tax=Streptomyces sp. enrichment culture TaxID=1795815 RepID=UPI003F544545
MTRGSTGNAPIYEDLVRELGDVVAEAQRAADHIEHQAADLLARRPAPRPVVGQGDGTLP